MPLHINEMGIEIKVGSEQARQQGEASCSEDDDARQRETEQRLVDEAVRRVLAILKASEAR